MKLTFYPETYSIFSLLLFFEYATVAIFLKNGSLLKIKIYTDFKIVSLSSTNFLLLLVVFVLIWKLLALIAIDIANTIIILDNVISGAFVTLLYLYTVIIPLNSQFICSSEKLYFISKLMSTSCSFSTSKVFEKCTSIKTFFF